MTTSQFLGFYSGRKLENYTKAAESLETLGFTPKDAWLSTFVKAEKICVSKKPDPAPRVIQPRTMRYNIELGRYLRHSEHYLFKAIDGLFGGRTIFKGTNADEAGEEMKEIWDSFQDPVGIGMDASRFDQHISVEALRYEHQIWLDMFPAAQRPHLKSLLELQIHNRGLARCPDGEIRYRVEGCRMSGDMNTSSGNCYIMCSTVWSRCTALGIKHFRLANNGDDCVVFLERKDLDTFLTGCVDYYKDLGFTMKIEEPVFELEQVEFCQTRPINVGGAYRMVRNPHASFSKDLCCIHDLADATQAQAWVSAVGQGGRALNHGVPVHQAFYERFPHCDAKLKGILRDKFQEDRLYKFGSGTHDQSTSITDEARYSYWLAFGLTPDEQVALENSSGIVQFQHLNHRVEEEASLLQYSRA
jgi:hypothetical protein